jgi:hypothetical protein
MMENSTVVIQVVPKKHMIQIIIKKVAVSITLASPPFMTERNFGPVAKRKPMNGRSS